MDPVHTTASYTLNAYQPLRITNIGPLHHQPLFMKQGPNYIIWLSNMTISNKTNMKAKEPAENFK